MRVIGVLDVASGVAVSGEAGRREGYRPVRSVLAEGSEPLALARALRGKLGLRELYVADLDALEGRAAHGREFYERLRAEGLELLLDHGMRHAPLRGDWRVVAGLETVAGPGVLGEGMVFSLDLRGGEPLGDLSGWPDPSPRGLVREAVRRGVRAVLFLDLQRIGTGQGTGTEDLCAWARGEFPALEIIAGGGIAGRADLDRLASLGVDAALVGSALHDGRLQAQAPRQPLNGPRP